MLAPASAVAVGRPPAPRLRPLPTLDLLRLLPADGHAVFYWEQPQRGTALLAVGAASEGRFRGEGRLRAAARWWQRVRPEGLPPRLPVAVGGFAFAPRPRRERIWRPFADALWWVPRLLLVRSPEGSCAVLFGADDADLERLLSPGTCPDRPPAFRPDPTDDAFAERVAMALSALRSGAAEKVVLARRLRLRNDGPFHPRPVLARLRARYPECTVFALARGGRWFLGATPETLLSACRGRVRADCLAGSAARGRTPEEDDRLAAALLADAKERHEHALVVEAAREALAPLCRRLWLPPGPTVRRLANIQHLHTPLEGELADATNLLEVAERLHPTPAVAGHPREAALALIARLEGFDRGWYAGAVGWLDGDGGGELAVAIRSAIVGAGQAVLYAGCGITSRSDPRREDEESLLKLQPMLEALGAA